MFDIIRTDKFDSFDDVIISHNIDTQYGEFSLTLTYLGGIGEDGSEDLEMSAGCCLEFWEVDGTYAEKQISELAELFEIDGEEVEKLSDTVYNSFPCVKWGVSVMDWSDYSHTQKIVKRIADYFNKGVL